ncbi:MAG: PaaX family transcriptional regulator [Gammaproteobacteria bacterium]|jgi:phenylacetic acid degradation operon negative regulatory protein
MAAGPTLAAWLTAILQARPPRAGSLIITVFGDSISGFSSAVGLASFIELLEPFGLNARQIRTAVFRLVKDDWLACEKIGRKSYYSFTDFGRRQFERSARRIYAARPASWNGLWTLVLPAFADGAKRDELKRELSWLGFGSLATGVLAHPSADHASLMATLDELELSGDTVVMRARAEDIGAGDKLRRLALQTWQLDAFAQRYTDLIAEFQPALTALEAGPDAHPAERFALQTLLIHEYRRILLKLTDLPDELLPAGWPGREAMELTARIYARTRGPAAAYLAANLEGSDGPLQLTADAGATRFA